MLKVRNMESTNSDRLVTNQFIIEDTERKRIAFQSYKSPIILIDYVHNIIVVYKHWDYSSTTGKYRNKFLREQGFAELASKKDLERYMAAGKYEDYTILIG